MKIKYLDKKFNANTRKVIDQANAIIDEYAGQGFDLTLRQLYYQFVARDLLKNKQSEYKRLGNIISDARLGGLIDWDRIEDRTRNLRGLSHWTSPASIVDACAASFRMEKWATQKYRPEVWIEKDALVGVFEGVCNRHDVPFFSCRGYTSQSEMWAAAQRLGSYKRQKQKPIIFHFGDHDPSGIDMSRDIKERLEMFMGGVEVRRLALTAEQIAEYDPPPNPAKGTDPRFADYSAEHGDESWELDALEPTVLAQLVEDAIESVRVKSTWAEVEEEEAEGRELLELVARHWPKVPPFIRTVAQEEDV